MAAFKPTPTPRGSLKTEGFYFTSVRYPIELAKMISRRANANEMSFSDYARQAIEFAIAADKTDVKGVKASEEIKISVGTTKDYSGKKAKAKKNGVEKKAKKPAKAKKVEQEDEETEEDEEEEAPKKKSKKAAKPSKPAKKAKKPAKDEDEEEVEEEESEPEADDEEVVDDE